MTSIGDLVKQFIDKISNETKRQKHNRDVSKD